ncbi:MAG TPA: uroporphyrinogen decarboxylase family protein [Anaerolineae bacterium]|nr:uroporphyrinogen decarboxylase family protein [Anaerolineae bacterium]
MRTLSPRERVLTALSLEEPDRVPLDLGGSASNMTDPVYFKVKNLLGIKGDVPPYRTGRTCNYYDERVFDALDIDFRWVSLKGLRNAHGLVAPDGTYTDEWGIGYRRMALQAGSVGHPLAHASIDDLEVYRWPDPRAPGRDEGLEEHAGFLYGQTEYAIAARPTPDFGVFEMCCALRGDAQYLMDLANDKPFARRLAQRITCVLKGFCGVLLDAAGPYLHMGQYSGDYGTQHSMIMSPDMYREMMKPFDKEIILFIKERAPQVKLMHHSCGAILPIMPDLIEIGVDVLNPLQPLAANTDSARIKAQFGDRLCFHGAIDIQRALPGTLEDVERESRTRLAALAPGGGYIVAPSNYIQPDVPPANVVELYRLAAKLGRYPLAL